MEIATDPEFSQIVWSTNKEDMCYSYVSVLVNGLSENETYYWRVKAFTNARSMDLAATNQTGPDYYILNGCRYPYLEIARDAQASDNLVIQNLSPFTDYQVEQTTNLMTIWEPYTNFTAPAEGQITVGSLSNSPPAQFYRISK